MQCKVVKLYHIDAFTHRGKGMPFFNAITLCGSWSCSQSNNSPYQHRVKSVNSQVVMVNCLVVDY